MSPFFKFYKFHLLPFLTLFILLQFLIRLIFFIQVSHQIDPFSIESILSFLIGLISDIFVFFYLSLPLLLLIFLIPERLYQQQKLVFLCAPFYFLFAYLLIFTLLSECFFWEEFKSRFNFIAVDYLIYTPEVLRNLRESYPLPFLLTALGVFSLFFTILYVRYFKKEQKKLHFIPSMWIRLLTVISMIGITTLSFFIPVNSLTKYNKNRYLNEISKNGMAEFFSAYQNNELSYEHYYVTENKTEILNQLQHQLNIYPSNFHSPLTRKIIHQGTEKKYNIVLLTVESLGANHIDSFGHDYGYTRHIDALAKSSLMFTQVYATGLRTIYGLSAITLSIPPLPGHAIPRRPHNEHLFNLGYVLSQKGYLNKFIYGGYGYFDNMNYFFSQNGYKIVDRSDFKSNEITFSNAWGVSDEDLYQRVLKENDEAYQQGRPFFDMVMTTSNHRPYTYPKNRIDIPTGTRDGAIKYTDYAIGKFIEAAKKRPWFSNTLFVIVADHTADHAGRIELEPDQYHIPFIIYAPAIITPQKINRLSSQIDIAPTLLGLLNISYTSRFYGKDILKDLKTSDERAFISNYQQLGYLTPKKLVVLKPMNKVDYYTRDHETFTPDKKKDPELLKQALVYFQNATQWQQWNQENDYEK